MLAVLLVPVVKADSLGGSHANWHHAKPYTRALQEPTQDEGTQLHEQFTRVAFGALSGNKPKNPSQITGRLPRTITNSCQCSSLFQAI
jgi:hypothetical protein